MPSKYARVGHSAAPGDEVASPASASAVTTHTAEDALTSPDPDNSSLLLLSSSAHSPLAEHDGDADFRVQLEHISAKEAPKVRLHGLGPEEGNNSTAAVAILHSRDSSAADPPDPYAPPLSEAELQASSVYLHPNGHLLSARLIPPTRGHGPKQAHLHGSDPRLHQAGFEPCPAGGQPNPDYKYHANLSGVDAERTIGLWEFISFGWVSPLIATGFKRDIDTHDMWLLPEPFMAHSYTPILFRNWHAPDLRTCTSNRLAWTVWRTFKSKLMKMWCMKWVIMALTLLRPVVLAMLLQGVTAGVSRWTQVSWVVLLSLTSVGQAVLTHHYWWIGVSVAMSVRGSAIGLVFDKSLKLHSAERSRFTSGRIASLANVDADNMRDFMWGAVHESWASPTLILLTSTCLFLLLGVSALVGVALLVASLALTSHLCSHMSALQEQIMNQGDKRVSLMVELVTSMKLIKLYAVRASNAMHR
jgi:hypothetical protein